MNEKEFNPADTDVWNTKDLSSPPVVTFDYTNVEYMNLFSNTNYHIHFNNQLQQLISLIETSRSTFISEKTIFDKLIYKNWNALRKEKAMQSMRRLKRILNSFEDMKISYLLISLNELTCNSTKQYLETSRKKSLPSKEMFEHFIVRLYSVYQLFEFAKRLIRDKIYFYLVKSIQMAVFLPNNLLFLGTVSRIYCILKKYNESISFLYGSLREHLHLFKATNIKWSTDFQLSQLPESLNMTNSNETIVDKHINESELLSINKETMNHNIIISNQQLEDLGVSIDREPSVEEEESCKEMKIKNKCSLKWKNLLIKNLVKFIGLTFKDKKFDASLLKKFKKKIVKFFDDKYSKNGEIYIEFLTTISGDKKALKRDNLMNESFDVKTKIKILNKLKAIVKNYISK